jgi:hypothetical protein
MKTECEYRGYRIECRSIGKLFAQIFPPGSNKALKETPFATQAEGHDYLLRLAYGVIDKKLAPA